MTEQKSGALQGRTFRISDENNETIKELAKGRTVDEVITELIALKVREDERNGDGAVAEATRQFDALVGNLRAAYILAYKETLNAKESADLKLKAISSDLSAQISGLQREIKNIQQEREQEISTLEKQLTMAVQRAEHAEKQSQENWNKYFSTSDRLKTELDLNETLKLALSDAKAEAADKRYFKDRVNSLSERNTALTKENEGLSQKLDGELSRNRQLELQLSESKQLADYWKTAFNNSLEEKKANLDKEYQEKEAFLKRNYELLLREQKVQAEQEKLDLIATYQKQSQKNEKSD